MLATYMNTCAQHLGTVKMFLQLDSVVPFVVLTKYTAYIIIIKKKSLKA